MKFKLKFWLLIGMMVIGIGIESMEKLSVKAAQRSKVTVKIAYLPITHALPLLVEEELGKNRFKQIKLELVKFGSWPELLDALNTGKVDGASVLIELALRAKEQGIDLKTVALGHRDGNVVIVAPEIKTVEDLKGKPFAIPHRLSSHHILLYQMLKKANLTYDSVKLIELPPPEMPAALAEGRIAGYIVAEPFGAKAVAVGKGKVLYKSQELWPHSVCCGIVLRNQFIKTNRAAARELVREYVKAGVKTESKDIQVDKIAAQYLKIEKKVLDLSLQWTSYQDLKLNPRDYEVLVKYMKELGLTEKPPAFHEFVDKSLL